jgi:hypothetical protein
MEPAGRDLDPLLRIIALCGESHHPEICEATRGDNVAIYVRADEPFIGSAGRHSGPTTRQTLLCSPLTITSPVC